jgi:hypothetical protein
LFLPYLADLLQVEMQGSREINYLRCNVEMLFSGEYRFHEGTRTGMMGNLFEIFVNREKFELYICPKCGKVEFFSPLQPSYSI